MFYTFACLWVHSVRVCPDPAEHLHKSAVCYLVILRCHSADCRHGVWSQSQLPPLGRREAGRLKVFGAQVGVGAQRAFVPLSQQQPLPPQLGVLGEPAGSIINPLTCYIL